MTATNKVLVGGVTTAGTGIETKYTSPAAGNGTRITAVTAVNTSAGVSNYTLYIVDDATAATDADSVVRSQSLASNAADTPPEVVNQFIPAGGTLQLKTVVAGEITFRISGIEYT